MDGRIVPHNWKGRQYQSDTSTARVQRFRKAKRNVSCAVSETAPDTDTETETDVAASVDATTSRRVAVKAASEVETRSNGAKPRRPTLIGQEAFALSDQVAQAMGLDAAHPSRVGMPMTIQHWLTSWHPEVILATVRSIMASRPGDPPFNLKYFENAIARAHADLNRQLPTATVTDGPNLKVIANGKTETLSEVALRHARDDVGFGPRPQGIRPSEGSADVRLLSEGRGE
jgi:hypothetical protein